MCFMNGQWGQMKTTSSAGAPARSADATSPPPRRGRRNGGSAVPSSSIVEGVALIWRGPTASVQYSEATRASLAPSKLVAVRQRLRRRRSDTMRRRLALQALTLMLVAAMASPLFAQTRTGRRGPRADRREDVRDRREDRRDRREDR